MTSTDRIAVVSSLDPAMSRLDSGREAGAAYQRLCVRSWLDSGFRVVSLNEPAEIGRLSPHFPEITFVPARKTLSAFGGGRALSLADLLAALAQLPEPIAGIVNCDILFEPSVAWREVLIRCVPSAIVTGPCHDTISLLQAIPHRRPWGFEYFFFERAAAEEWADRCREFAFGRPFWDHALLLSAALAGREIRLLEHPWSLHLDHAPDHGRQGAIHGARCLIELARKFAAGLPATAPAWCGALFAALGKEAEPEPVAKLCLDAVAANGRMVFSEPRMSRRGAATDQASLTPASVFEGFDARLRAEGTRSLGFAFAQNGRMPEAERVFRSVLSALPDDAGALNGLADALARTGRAQEALAPLQRAARCAPHALVPLVSLGFALTHANRTEEAASLFRRAIALDPDPEGRDYRAFAHFGLARLLAAAGQGGEALKQLAAALGVKPDYAEAKEGYYQLQLALAPPASRASAEAYFGRQGEDALIDAFFGRKTTGSFVDVGAFDGRYLSATCFFERRGWSGVCIEAAPRLFELCRRNRPRSRCVNLACVATGGGGTVAFRLDASGLFSGVSADVNRVAAAYAALSVPFEGLDIVRVPSATLDAVLADGPAEIDVLALGVGADALMVLAGFDLPRFRPRLVLVRAGQGVDEKALDEALAARGYGAARALGDSRFYARGEADRRRLRGLVVSARLDPAPHPMGPSFAGFGYPPGPYVYWPADQS